MQKQKQERKREKKWLNHLEPFSFYTLEELFRFANPWSGGEGEELKQRCCFFCLGFWVFPFLALGFLVSFLSSVGGAPKIDLPLSMFSLANTFFTSLFSYSTLLLGGTKTVVLVEAILGEEKLYHKPVWLEADF